MAEQDVVSPCTFNWREALQVPEDVKRTLDRFRSRELLLAKCVTSSGAGIPFFKRRPCMLLHQLTSFEHSNADDLACQVSKARTQGGRLVICAGSTGCGKTKSLYTFFSREERGLVFTTNTLYGGGSSDLEFLMNEVFPKHLQHRDYYQNSVTVKFFMLLLLLVRMSILSLCQDFSMETWLMLQAGCKELYNPDASLAENTDVFTLFLDLVCRKTESLAPENFVKEIPALQEALDKLCTPFEGLPTVAIDEAHRLVAAFSDDFFVSRRPFYRDVVNFLLEPTTIQTKHVVIVSGTGYTLKYEESGSSARPPVCGDFGCWRHARDMISYAGQVIDLTREDRSLIENEIYPRFKGRYRPFVQVVETALNKTWSIKEAAVHVEKALTTSDGGEDSFYVKLGQVPKLFGFMERAVINYFCLGRGITIHDTQAESQKVEEIVDAGFGRLVASLNGHSVSVDEYLVLRAAANVFRDRRLQGSSSILSLKDELFVRMEPDMKPRTSHLGFLYQNFGPLAFQRMWKQHRGVMNDMPFFTKILQAPECPEQLKSVAVLESEILEGNSPVCMNFPEYGLREFFLERRQPLEERTCTTFVCHESLGPDAAFRIRFETPGDDLGIHFDGFDQYKYWREELNQFEINEAIMKCGIQEDLQEEYELCENVQLCFLYLYPCKYPELFRFKTNGGKLQVICFVHAENARYIFTPTELELLDLIGQDDYREDEKVIGQEEDDHETSSEEYPFF